MQKLHPQMVLRAVGTVLLLCILAGGSSLNAVGGEYCNFFFQVVTSNANTDVAPPTTARAAVGPFRLNAKIKIDRPALKTLLDEKETISRKSLKNKFISVEFAGNTFIGLADNEGVVRAADLAIPAPPGAISSPFNARLRGGGRFLEITSRNLFRSSEMPLKDGSGLIPVNEIFSTNPIRKVVDPNAHFSLPSIITSNGNLGYDIQEFPIRVSQQIALKVTITSNGNKQPTYPGPEEIEVNLNKSVVVYENPVIVFKYTISKPRKPKKPKNKDGEPAPGANFVPGSEPLIARGESKNFNK